MQQTNLYIPSKLTVELLGQMLFTLGTSFQRRKLKLIQRFWLAKLRRAEKIGASDTEYLRKRVRQIGLQITDIATQDVVELSDDAVVQLKLSPPPKSDWGFRPGLWTHAQVPMRHKNTKSGQDLCQYSTLFFDGDNSVVHTEQVPQTKNDIKSDFGLRIVSDEFNGSYLSLVVNLPKPVLNGLSKGHIIQTDLVATIPKECEVFGRLNLKSDTGVQQIIQKFKGHDGEMSVFFDLHDTPFQEHDVSKTWIDISFTNPAGKEILINDLTTYRRRRASI